MVGSSDEKVSVNKYNLPPPREVFFLPFVALAK